MQLVRIENTRCAEWDGFTYVLAPDDWSEESISSKVNTAVDNYIAEVKKAREREDKRQPGRSIFQPEYHKADPDKTVGEVRKEFERIKAKREQWREETMKQRTWSFIHFLEEQGFFALYSEEAAEFVVEASADWGHMHGYSELHYETMSTPHIPPDKVAGIEPPVFG